MTYRIKKLEWKDISMTLSNAQGLNEQYRVSYNGSYWWRYGRNIGQFGEEDSMEKAKAAAQRHHEQQLMKWLEPAGVFIEGDCSKMEIHSNTFHEHAPVGRITPNAMTKQRVKTIQEAFRYYLDKKKDKTHD